jgi:iron complex transport system substrate-binding protein
VTLRRASATPFTAVVLALVSALALSACGMTLAPPSETGVVTGPAPEPTAAALPLTELDVLADPGSYVGPSTATLAIPSLDAPGSAPAQSMPVTVTSHDRDGDREVTITDASRVVAVDLAGSIADTMWALGLDGNLVGRDVAASFPGSQDVPVVTGASHSVTPEAILALEPTLVLTDGSVGPREALEQLRDVGITVVFLENTPSFDGASQLARDVAAALGAADAGADLADRLATAVGDVQGQIAKILPSTEPLRMMFLYLRGTAGVYYLFGEGSGADELIAGLGGVDVASDMGVVGTRPLTDEAMLTADPDVILVMTSGLESVGGAEGLIAAWPAIALTGAGEHQRIVNMEDTQVLSFGPRSAAVLDALARAVYAPDSQ